MTLPLISYIKIKKEKRLLKPIIHSSAIKEKKMVNLIKWPIFKPPIM